MPFFSSYDFNPIEKCFSKVKGWLKVGACLLLPLASSCLTLLVCHICMQANRELAEREGFPYAIFMACASISPEDMLGYYNACGVEVPTLEELVALVAVLLEKEAQQGA